jgi:DNA-binding MurR/RpiR family transcriptional regulator
LEDLGQKLKQYLKSGTPAERRIARYFADHLNELPFETASSVADRLELSPMTVGRFLRALGYQGLDGIKVHLRETVPAGTSQLPDAIEQLRKDVAEGRPLAALMAEQIETLHYIYNLAGQPQWRDAVAAVTSANEVFVASHQGTTSVGNQFCDRLEAARDRVKLAGGPNGNYVELLAHETADSLLIVIDSHRFAKSRLLARSARRAGYKVLLITSQYTEWAHEFANITLSLPPSRVSNRDSHSAMTALLEFFAAAVGQATGDDGEARERRIAELEGMFADVPHR